MNLELLTSQLPCHAEPISPFGLRLSFNGPAARTLANIPVQLLAPLLLKHRVLSLHGLAPIEDKQEFSEACLHWGPLLEWGFGTVFEVVEHADPKNYLFTNGSVPYHWDGAFAEHVPWLQCFHCRESPGRQAGGETLFCDTTALWNSLTPEFQQLCRSIDIEYTTDKVAHYGGRIRAPLVGQHPITGETVLRFAEPANSTTVKLNTPELQLHGIAAERAPAFLEELIGLLYDTRFVYAHRWNAGDFVIADNHVLLHGRSKYQENLPRRLWRVHVLEQTEHTG